MEKKMKRIDAEFQLPEPIIQHIQSFLNAKEAAQTTLLCKSWNGAWLTRPNFDFDDKYFERNLLPGDGFFKFVKKTVERYEKLNLKILTLRLHIDGYWEDISSLARKYILKALKMGATGLDFKIGNLDSEFALPHEVFGSENLIRLSLSNCKIGLGVDGKVRCWRLKSLDLESVDLEGDIIQDIISSCPLIENLSLSQCYNGSTIRFGSANSPFNKLKSLFLFRIGVDTLFFDDFCSRFPCLKNFSLEDCFGYKEIKISSPLLECISFTQGQDMMLNAKFDVPSIRKFTFSGPNIPLLSFKTRTSNWESNISISCYDSPNTTWYLDLNKLLKELSMSKISLSLETHFHKRFDCPEEVNGLPRPEVENLTISLLNANCLDLLDGLFRCCRPIYVTQHWHQLRHSSSSIFWKVYSGVMQQAGFKCGLDQVDVEFFDEAVSSWRPRLIDVSVEQRVRLHLIWRC